MEKEYLIEAYVDDPRIMELNREYCLWYNSLKKKYEENFNKLHIKYEDVTEIFIIGHSYNEIDLPYFELLNSKLGNIKWNMYYFTEEDLKRLENYVDKLNLQKVER